MHISFRYLASLLRVPNAKPYKILSLRHPLLISYFCNNNAPVGLLSINISATLEIDVCIAYRLLLLCYPFPVISVANNKIPRAYSLSHMPVA